uniref:Ancestral antigen receptor B6 n=1 Tax=Eptatretus burgeri TaxID=7764 RepID=Q5DWN1_EPTBU|nr:ancestral antigen receptor B6 [Eptatretus burgeri]
MNCFVGDFYLPLVLVFTFQPTEMLGQDHCVCTEKSPPPSIDLSVSQQTTTITTNVNGRAEFHCNVSIMNRSTDHPLVYWYKDCPNSVGGKTVFSGKSPSGEYINRVNQTVHETQEHENLTTRRFTLEILHPNVNDSGDYFCVTIIRTKDGSFGSCGGGTKLEVVEDATSKTPTTTRDDATAAATTEITKGSGKYIIAICIGVPILVLMIAATVLVFARMQRNKRPSQQFNGEPGNGTLEDTDLTYASVYIPPRNGEQLANKKEGRMDGIYSVVTYEPKNKRNS